MKPVNILIADDHPLIRSGLRMLLETHPSWNVRYECGSFDEVIQALKADLNGIDLITIDVTMPAGRVEDVIKKIRRDFDKVKIIVLTMHDDPSMARDFISFGAHGFVTKSSVDTELIAAVKTVLEGGVFVCGTFQLKEIDLIKGKAETQFPFSEESPLNHLSSRELEVALLVSDGFSSKQIAEKIFLSIKTVDSYRSRIMGKLGVRNRAELVQLMREEAKRDRNSKS